MLLRVARSMSPQAADANDLVQDTLTRAWRSFDTFDGEHPRAWLMTIMRNADHNRYRKQTPIPVDVADRAQVSEPSPEKSAEDRVLELQLDEVVAEALRQLKPAARELIVLVDVDGLSYREAGAYLGVPEGTVMSRLHRARAKVRKRIEKSKVQQSGGSDE